MMKVQTQIDELITLRASEWFEILKNPAEAERTAFIAWLSESRRHVQEFLEVAALDEAVGGMPAELREDLTQLVARVAPPAISLPRRARALRGHSREENPRRSPGRTRWKISRWAAACACVTVGAALAYWTLHPSTHYATDIGEQRTIELADASLVTLNADSRIQWHLDESQREVELLRGEAIFKVAHDASRPFRVHTRAGVVRAIGTQFNVYAREAGDTRVSVLEGRVQLTAAGSAEGSASQTLILKTGEEADIRLDGTIARNVKASVANAVAWRGRRLVFSDVLLEDMIVEFNRYNRTPRLRLEDVPSGAYRFAGTFYADDSDSLATLLSRESDLMVERREGEILIRKR